MYFYFCLVVFLINWILAFLCGIETRSAFSCEYSYFSLIPVEYTCLATTVLLALVLHAPLVSLKFFGEFLGLCFGSENVACGSGMMINLHNVVYH